MDFPTDLWTEEADRRLLDDLLGLFEGEPVVLVDRLLNSVHFNAAAEGLFAARGEAIVNRSAFSLLGLGEREQAPESLVAALLGEGAPWRGGVRAIGEDAGGAPAFCEATAIVRDGHHVAGVLRLRPMPGTTT
jgi:hypothetical protein